jgi:hypothetical protein
LVVGACTSITPAFGQTDEQRAGARSLATDGAAAFKEGRFKDAVDLFSKAESLVHAPPHLLFLARAHTKLGQLVRAREAYLKIVKEQLTPSAPPAFREAQGSAQRELAAIEPKIGSLAIKVEGSESAKDLAVKIDDVPISAVLVGSSQPIDPGDHKIEAAATGFRAQPQFIKVTDGEKASITLKLESDANAPPPTAAATPGAANAAAPGAPPGTTATPGAPPADTGTSGGGSNGMRIGAYAAFGVGAVGIGLGTVFLLKASGKHSDASDLFDQNHCGVSLCTKSIQDQVNQLDADGKSASTLGIVGFVIGGAAVVTGVTLLVMSSGTSEAKTASVQPWIGLNSAGLSGTF